MAKALTKRSSAATQSDGELVKVEVWVKRFPSRTMFLRQEIASGQFQHADGPEFEVTLNLGGGAYLCHIGDGDWYVLGPGEFASACLPLYEAAAKTED